jgi:hypothetical protein
MCHAPTWVTHETLGPERQFILTERRNRRLKGCSRQEGRLEFVPPVTAI